MLTKSKIIGLIASGLYLVPLLIYINQGQLYGSNILTVLSALLIYSSTIFAWIWYFLTIDRSTFFSLILCFVGYSYLVYLFSESSINVPFTMENVSTILFCNYTFLILSSCLISYLLTVRGLMKKTMLIGFGLCFVLLGVFNMIYFMGDADLNTFTKTNNYIYSAVAIIPMIPLLKRKIYINLVMIIVLILAVISLKRGAVFLVSISLLAVIVFQVKSFKGMSVKEKMGYMLIFFFSFFLFSDFLLELYDNSTGLYMRVEQTMEGGTSGRDSMYGKIMVDFFDSDIFNVVFGHGIYSTVNLIGNYAHNDYLEVLYDLGLVGFCFLILFYIKVYTLLKYTESDIDLKCTLILIMIFLYIKSFYSMCIYDFNSFPAFIMLGYVLGHIKMRKQNINLRRK